MRVLDAYGDGRHQDLLTVASGNDPVLQHLMLPVRSFFARPYSSERIRFNPWNTGADIQPVTWINRLRDAAYKGSQSARSV